MDVKAVIASVVSGIVLLLAGLVFAGTKDTTSEISKKQDEVYKAVVSIDKTTSVLQRDIEYIKKQLEENSEKTDKNTREIEMLKYDK